MPADARVNEGFRGRLGFLQAGCTHCAAPQHEEVRPLKNILILIAAATVIAGCGHDHHRRDRDRDHNGIPDRYERNRDSDGDGVPDRYDRRPYDPRRN